MFTLVGILKILGWLLVAGLGFALVAFWEDILNFVKGMLERGKEAVIKSKWNARTKRLVITIIDKLTGRIEKEEDTYVDPEEIRKMVPEIYTAAEAENLIREMELRKSAKK